MANIKKNEFDGMVVIVPRSNNGYKEGYAQCGSKKIPFNVPVRLSDHEKHLIERQKEASINEKGQNPYEIAKDRGISMEQAMKMAEQMGSNNQQIAWRPMYSVEKA